MTTVYQNISTAHILFLFYTVKMITAFKNIFFKLNTIILLGVGSLFLFFILRVVPVYNILKNSFSIPTMTLSRKIDLFFQYTWSAFLDISFTEQFLTIALAFATVMNIILLIKYAQRQQKILSGKSFFASVSGIVLGLFGVGCVSCGVLFLAPVISFIGLGAYLGGITQYALVLSYAGLALVLVSIWYLLKKLSEPLVCV